VGQRLPGSARRVGSQRAVLLIALLAVGASLSWAAESSSESVFLGSSLTEALLELRARGLKIVFTSNVVTAEMRVEVEPVATGLRDLLAELLAPHGLAARDGPDGTAVVVPRGPSTGGSSIGGFVRARDDGAPLSGATVRVVESAAETTSVEDGGFVIPDSDPGTFTLEARLQGFLTARLDEIVVTPGGHTEVTLLLDPVPVIEEQLVVTPSRISLLREEPTAPLELSREEILRLPHLGDDFFRALTLLPGATANDISAQFHVRGGRRDETQILLDGQELFDAFHLKDFDSALSFVAAATLSSADLNTGGFSAQYGDRMSGVLDMSTITPARGSRIRVGAGVLNAHVGGDGVLGDDRGSWIAEVRRGSIDLVARLLGDEDPEYWDAFGKLDYRLGRRNVLRGNLLYSGDALDFEEVIEEERKRFETEYDSSHLWLTLQTTVSASQYFDTAASVVAIDRDRRGLELEEGASFAISDQRESEVHGLRQSWYSQLTPKQSLEWGWQLREFETEYDYVGTHEFDNPLAQIRHDAGLDSTTFRGEFDDRQEGVYVADRIRLLEPLTLELGLRYDHNSQTSESHVTPRLNLAYAPDERSVVRAAWGRFNQSQRSYELQVEDGEESFHPVERAEHRVLGFERLFGGGGASPGLALRFEIYQREVGNPRPRYENLYEPINTFPEVEPDRVRIAPDRHIAEGAEVFLRGTAGPRVAWWANYTYASTEDRIDGVWVPRIFDETHSLNLDVDFRVSDHWRVNLAWRYHTGWPTTPLTLQEVEDEEGESEFVPVLGPLNSDRLPSYHRLDLRASRGWRFRSTQLDFFIDIQNLYNRRNVAGFDIEIDEEEGTVVILAEEWTGFFPSAGISVEF
jgi:outer membrane receptor protein involved in Fe transport